MATATLTLEGDVLGLTSGTKKVKPAAMSLASAVGQTLAPLTLASGDNTLSIPTGTTVIVFVPPTGNANTILLKGAAGDTGVQLKKTQWSVIAWDGSGAVILNASAQITECEISFL